MLYVIKIFFVNKRLLLIITARAIQTKNFIIHNSLLSTIPFSLILFCRSNVPCSVNSVIIANPSHSDNQRAKTRNNINSNVRRSLVPQNATPRRQSRSTCSAERNAKKYKTHWRMDTRQATTDAAKKKSLGAFRNLVIMSICGGLLFVKVE